MSLSIFSFFQAVCLVIFLNTFCEATPLHMGKRHSHLHKSKSVQRRDVYGAGLKVTAACANFATSMNDGLASPVNIAYAKYSGGPDSFPHPSQWISFDAMFEANRPLMQQSCQWNGWATGDQSNHIINYIREYIQVVARDSGVDHRAILAVIMQESGGCLHTPITNNGVANPGIMQSHNGVSFNAAAPCTSIHQMIVDGTQGTSYGDGLAQLINQYGDYYSAFRAYNSGSIAGDGDLSNGNGATASYVSDAANRLMGWTTAPSAF